MKKSSPTKFLFVCYYRLNDKSVRIWNDGKLIAELNKDKRDLSDYAVLIRYCQDWLYEHNKFEHAKELKIYIEIL